MPDLIDRAQEAEEVNIQDALDAHRSACVHRESLLPSGNPNRAANECSICEGAIETRRLSALPATKFCSHCARDFEKMMKKEAKWM